MPAANSSSSTYLATGITLGGHPAQAIPASSNVIVPARLYEVNREVAELRAFMLVEGNIEEHSRC